MNMKRTIDLDTMHLSAGAHAANDGEQMCVMEAVAWLAGEPWSDAPECASLVIAAFCRAWNDTPEPYGQAIRDRLRGYIPRLIGTRGTPEQEERRAWLALDWLIRVQMATWLRAAGLTEHAERIANLPPQTSRAALRSSAAARDAAWVAAGDVAGAAAGAAYAAAYAAWNATGVAAGAVASAAAWNATGVATGDAAWNMLRPTVEELQASAWQLLDAMIACE